MARDAPRPETRDGFTFRSGHVALDLTATLTGRLREVQVDLLAEPADLARWLVAAGLVARRPGVSRAELERARLLREALYRLVTAAARRRPLPAADRLQLNRIAAAPAAAPALMPDGGIRIEGSSGALLASIARLGVELLGGEPGTRIRRCAGDHCAIHFVDDSRTGERRWCSMAACGNRAKAAQFRRRATSGRG